MGRANWQVTQVECAGLEPELKPSESLIVPKKDDQPFRFFSLPRELRDLIYDCDLQNHLKRKLTSQHHARLRGRRVARTPLLLVSKQFREEYFSRVTGFATLVVVDRGEFHGELLKLPSPLSYVKNLELHLAIACDDLNHLSPGTSSSNPYEGCRVLRELRMHRKWIVHLARQMRWLNEIKVTVYVDPHLFIDACENEVVSEAWRLLNVEEVVKLQVCRCEFVGKGAAWSFAKPREVVMRMGEGRVLERVPKVIKATEHGEGEGKVESVDAKTA